MATSLPWSVYATTTEYLRLGNGKRTKVEISLFCFLVALEVGKFKIKMLEGSLLAGR